MNKKKHHLSYAKWGYIFILPFFVTFFIFSLIPLVDTVRYSFFEYYRSGIKEVGPTFIGLENYVELLKSDMIGYAGNTLILWIIGFVPQIVIALLLANWFTDVRLKIRGKQFFKIIIYLPNLIMASAFAMLFFALFSTNGPINSILMSIGLTDTPIDFMGTTFGTRSLIGYHADGRHHGHQPRHLRGRRTGRLRQLPAVLLHHPAADPPHSGLHPHHLHHRRSADVRCTPDPHQRPGQPRPYLHDAAPTVPP